MTAVPARLLVPVGLAVAAVRWLVSFDRQVFHVTPDEPGQLAMARWLSGGTRWNMFDHSTWRPAFAAVIAPIQWLTDDPTLGFRLAIVVNAVLGGLAAVLLCLLARRITTLSASWCAVAAVIASLLPGVLFPTAWVWAESLVALTVTATALLLARFVDSPTAGRAVGAGLVTGGAFAVHGRLFPLAATATVVAVEVARRRRSSWAAAAALVATTIITGLAAQWWSSWVVDHVWEDPTTTNSAGGLIERLARPGAVALSATGQVWYLLASTACVAGLGAIGLVRLTRHGRVDAAVTLATVAPLVAVSLVFIADRTRPDHLVYGRYNDAVIAPVLVVGLAMLLGDATPTLLRRAGVASIATLAVSAAVLLALRGDELAASAGVRAMVVGIQWFGGTRPSIPVLGITVVAGLVATLLIAIASSGPTGRRPAAAGALVVAIVVAGWRTDDVLEIGRNAWTSARAVESVQGSIVPAGEEVRFREVPSDASPSVSWSDQQRRRMLYQLYLPHNEMVLDATPGSAELTPFVFAPLGDPVLTQRGAEVLWRDPAVAMGLWRDPRAR